MSRVLVVAPHVDDEINCAGALLMTKDSDKLILACSPCYESMLPGYDSGVLLREFGQAVKILQAKTEICDWPVRQLSKYRQEILERLLTTKKIFDPNVVICPSSTDVHQDHITVYEECMRAFRNVHLLLGWESPNNQRTTHTNFFVSMTEKALEKKLEVYNCYESQKFREHFDSDLFKSLAVVRGRQSRSPTGLAEAYEVLNVLL